MIHRLRRELSARSLLAFVAFVMALPALVFAVALLIYVNQVRRDQISETDRATADRMAVAVDRELTGYIAALEALATSPSLRRGAYGEFMNQAMAVRRSTGAHGVLQSAGGLQLVNTRRPFGAPQTVSAESRSVARALASGRPAISDVFLGRVARKPVVTVTIPATGPGGAALALRVNLETTRFRDAILGQRLSDRQTVRLLDGGGQVIAAISAAGAARAPDGFSPSATVRPRFAGGWRVESFQPNPRIADLVEGPLLLLLVFGGIVFAAAGVAVAVLSRRAVQPIRALAGASRQAIDGREIVPLRTGIRETSELSEALAAMSRDLRTREAERDDAERELRRSEADLRALADTLEERVTARSAELARAEDQVRQLQKIESLGRLTGGIAHDFNNMLAIVTGNLDLARRTLPPDAERADGYLANAGEGARRASELTARLLAFSRQQPLAAELLDPDELVAGMSDLLRRTLGETIRVEVRRIEAPVSVLADRLQLENAILNLCVNARDAMPGGGRLLIETALVQLEQADEIGGVSLPAGSYVMLCVTDDGVGMDQTVMSRIFEPFFTTKGVGQGTGLGLSQVHGFARQSGGGVRVSSHVGRGTTVAMLLPQHDGVVGQAAMDADDGVVPGTRDEVILVVEDEDRVRRMTVDALRELGYSVISAADGSEALEQLALRPAISLLLTDMVMPGMTGARLAERARQARPDLPVLFATGYTEEAIPGIDLARSGALLKKPYSLVTLSRMVRQQLTAPVG